MCVFHPTWVSPGGTRNWGSGVFICAAYTIGECATTAGSHRFEPPVSRLTPPVPSAIHNFTYFRLLAIRLLNHEQGALATRSQERCRQIRKWQYVPQLLNCCFGLGEVLLAICAWSGSGIEARGAKHRSATSNRRVYLRSTTKVFVVFVPLPVVR